MSDILITGAAGFLGSHLMKDLLSAGYAVRGFDNYSRVNAKNLPSEIQEGDILMGDVRHEQDLISATKGVDTVFHLASIQGTRNFYSRPEVVLDVGLTGAINLAKACALNGVKRVVFASSSEVYGFPRSFPTKESRPLIVQDVTNPRWSYSTQKIAGEVIFINFARKSGFDYSIVRIHNAYGPRMGWDHVIPEFIKRIILNEEFIMEGDGDETRSFCFVTDIVDGMKLAGTDERGRNEVFNIGNPSGEISMNKLADKLANLAGRRIDPVHVPKKEGSVRRRVPDIGKARRLLGFEPTVDLEEGLSRTLAWYRDEIRWWQENGGGKHLPWKAGS